MVTERLAPPDAEQQKGAMSQVYDLYDGSDDEATFLGTFHRYRNPDGSVGASGKEDPIMLLVDDTVWYDP